MRGLGAAEMVDLEALADSDENERVRGQGEYAFLDLKPGRYAVGVKRNWSDAICVHEVVEVGTSLVTPSRTSKLPRRTSRSTGTWTRIATHADTRLSLGRCTEIWSHRDWFRCPSRTSPRS